MSVTSSSNDLRNRIIFTLAILSVYRFGTFIPLPGIDPEQLKILMLKIDGVENVTFVKPGFLNLNLSNNYWNFFGINCT